MRTIGYLNTVLTVLAVLLTLNLWTAWATTPGGEALSLTSEAAAQPEGLPNAAAQRKAILDELKRLNVSVSAMQGTLTDGSMRARIEMPASEN